MNVEEMLKFLGVRTQSKESIELCYIMDLEAFNMMSDDNNNFENERIMYKAVYENLMNELGYRDLDQSTKEANDKIISIINTEEVDKDYRDQHFTGLERILLKYNRFDLIGYQSIKESSIDGMAKDAYLYELSGDYMMAAAYYKKLGYADRLKVVESKLK
ncbi:MAG: hypothetical protein IJM36_02545 [Acholeplasmatales bacterium]|nr:hypothetical protein [Acholeplasmatales bacterium]